MVIQISQIAQAFELFEVGASISQPGSWGACAYIWPAPVCQSCIHAVLQ